VGLGPRGALGGRGEVSELLCEALADRVPLQRGEEPGRRGR
jgi:hypothetical protein